MLPPPGRTLFRPWRLLPRYTRLIDDGAVVPAVVLKNDYVGNPGVRRITVRVLFEDAPPVEITRTEGHVSASQMVVGDRIDVRVSEDRRRIQIDMPRWARRVERRRSRAQGKAVRRTERAVEEERRTRDDG